MNQRDRVAKLAKMDFAGALKLAGSITSVREHVQALGWVARYAPDSEIPRVVAAANEAAVAATDSYAATMSLAWPLRALHETGHERLIPPLLTTSLELSVDVRPAASRAEAVALTIHAVLPNGLATATPAITALKSVAVDSHWRVVRALVNVSLLVNAFDRQSAMGVAATIPSDKKRIATQDRIVSGEWLQPRQFYW